MNIWQLTTKDFSDRDNGRQKETKQEDEEEDKDYECQFCGKTFSTEQGKIVHEKRWCDEEKEAKEAKEFDTIEEEFALKPSDFRKEEGDEVEELRKEVRELKHILTEEVAIRDVLEDFLEHERRQTRILVNAIKEVA